MKITELYEAAQNQTYEKQSAGLDAIEREGLNAEGDAIRARLHTIQHEMLQNHKSAELNAQLKMKCVELLEKIPAQERSLQKLKKAGKMVEAEQVQTWIDKAKANSTVYCPTPLR